MNNIKNSFLEDEIFGTSSDSINTLEVQNYQDEIEGDIEDDFIDNLKTFLCFLNRRIAIQFMKS